MSKTRIIIGVFVLSGLFLGCKKTSSSSYTPDCTGAAKSYQTNVAPIIQSACLGCHDSGSGRVNLSGYSALFSNRSSVRADIVSGRMPQNSSLSDAQKNNIVCWIDNGAPNN